jgi:hypothetical protein
MPLNITNQSSNVRISSDDGIETEWLFERHYLPQSTPARKPELNQNTISAVADWLQRLEIENGKEMEAIR